MSAVFSVLPNQERYLAVRALPENAEDIRSLFGDGVRRTDHDHWMWEIVRQFGHEVEPVVNGDWIVLSPDNSISRHSPSDFAKGFTIMENVFNIEITQEGS